MSTIKSSSEHLTLNADGASKDIKFQANGVEKVIVKSDGSVGVGTSSPEGKIEINDGSYAKMVLDVTGSKAFIQTSKWDGTNPGRDLVIQTKQSDGETARFLADGGITFNGDTAAANALDDYEEGTFTPTFTNIGTGTYDRQDGTYTKIGRVCTIQVHLDISTQGNASGNIQVSGLPFTSANISAHYSCSSSIHGTSWTTSRTSLNGILLPNSTTMNFYQNMAGTGSGYTTNINDIGAGNLLFQMTYHTS